MTTTNKTDWAKHKFAWLTALARDPAMRGVPLAVGVLLALRYLHPEKRYAWPSVGTLAAELGVVRSTMQRAVAAMYAARWLEVHDGSGRGHSNQYRLPSRFPDSGKGGKGRVHATPIKGRVHALKGRVDASKGPRGRGPSKGSIQGREAGESSRLRRETLSDPRFSPSLKATDQPSDPTRRAERSNPIRRAERSEPAADRVVDFRPRPASHQPTKQRDAAPRHGKAQPFPQQWDIGNTELATAQTICGWDLPQAQEQFEAFRDKALDQGWTSHNWSAAWKGWCRRDREYASRQQSQPVTGLRSGMLGAQQWLNEQNRKQSRRDEEPDE
jgi:hypothetical protein